MRTDVHLRTLLHIVQCSKPFMLRTLFPYVLDAVNSIKLFDFNCHSLHIYSTNEYSWKLPGKYKFELFPC